MDFATHAFNIQALRVVQTIGLSLMHVVFVVLAIRRVMDFMQRGHADFLTPFVHYCIGLACVMWLPAIGQYLVEVTRIIAAALYADQSYTEFLTSEIAYAKQRDDWTSLWDFLNGGLLRFLARTCIVFMLVFKIVLIDIVWQVLFVLAVWLGAFSIPFALAYGGSALSSWFKLIAELMMWPVIYSLLMLLVHSIIARPDSFLLSETALEEDLKRICASCAVLLLTGLTPLIARIVMNVGESYAMSSTAGRVRGGTQAGLVLATGGAAAVGGAVGAAAGAAGRAVMQPPGGGAWRVGDQAYRTKREAYAAMEQAAAHDRVNQR